MPAKGSLMASDKARKIGFGLGGWENPDSHIKCGPADQLAKFLEPVHIGGCKECRRVIIEMLKERHPAPIKRAAKHQRKMWED